MSLPARSEFLVDTKAYTFIFIGAEPSMVFQSADDRKAGLPKQQKTDDAGQPIFTYALACSLDGAGSMIDVAIPVDPSAFSPGTPVGLDRLVARYWASRDKTRSGLIFTAAGVQPAK